MPERLPEYGIHDLVDFKDKPTPDYRSRATDALIKDHSRLREQNEQAAYDTLTGLRRRERFIEDAERLYERSHRGGSSVVIMFADLNSLKRVNDTMGHEIGDKYLRHAADELRYRLRPTDVTGRWGGDELVAAFSVIKGFTQEHLVELGKDFKTRINAGMEEQTGYPNAVSVGLTFWTPDQELADAIGVADQLMYQDKHPGRTDGSVQSR
jgi:diguanylate cyclase (GGDEF)-like protein